MILLSGRDSNSSYIFHKLSRLPMKRLCRLRCSSKNFSSLLSEMHFINNHLRHSSLHPSIVVSEPNHVFLIGSLNLRSYVVKQLARLPNSYTRSMFWVRPMVFYLLWLMNQSIVLVPHFCGTLQPNNLM